MLQKGGLPDAAPSVNDHEGRTACEKLRAEVRKLVFTADEWHLSHTIIMINIIGIILTAILRSRAAVHEIERLRD